MNVRNHVVIASSSAGELAEPGRRHAGVKSATTCVTAVWRSGAALVPFARAAGTHWRHASWWLLLGVDHPTRKRLAYLATVSLFAVCGSISAAWAYDAELAWSRVNGAVGYKVYVRAFGQSYGAGSNVGTGTLGSDGAIHYVVTGLVPGVTEFFAVTDYNPSGTESGLSNELSLLVPPTATPTGGATSTYTARATGTMTATQPTRTATPSGPTQTATRTAVATATQSRSATPTVTSTPISGAMTIWDPATIPATAADPDPNAVELGVKFTADVPGLITGIRYYKSSTNTGTHTATLWSSAGALLATATFTNETVSGWQQVNFAAPVVVVASTVYVASYHTNVGHYSANNGYFTNSGFDNPPLHALRTGVSGGNGVYSYGASAFPTDTYNASNYWVDVVFSTAPPTTPTTAAPATPTSTASRTATATQTGTATPSRTATATTTSTATPTRTAPRTSSATAVPNTATPTGTQTAIVNSPSPTRSGSPTPTATPLQTWVVSLPSDARVASNKTTVVPLSIQAGSGVHRFAIDVAFNPTAVGLVAAQLSSLAGAGTLNLTVNGPGDVLLTGSLVAPFTAGGSLVDLTFGGAGACPTSSALVIASCTLDDGAVGCAPRNGSIDVRCRGRGHIASNLNSAPVGNAMVALSSADGQTATAMTDQSGEFAIPDLTAGMWTIEPSKTGDLQNAVSAFDAALVLQAVAGQRSLDPMQTLACDVTGNGSVTTLDATRILQFAVGLIRRVPVATVCGSDWAFVPEPASDPNQTDIEPVPGDTSCQPGSVVLDAQGGDAPALDFTAVPFGDCSGNWLPSQTGTALLQARRVTARAGAARRVRGSRWLVPIAVGGATGFHALQAHLEYDSAAVVPIGVRAVGHARQAMVSYRVGPPGELVIALASADSMSSGSARAVVFFDSLTASAAPRARLLDATIDDLPAQIVS